MLELLFEPAFVAWGVPTTWLELIAVVLAFVCVVFNVLENPIGWPFAIVSSALYTWLFVHNRIYGDAMVQVYFALAAMWAWWEWLFGRRRAFSGKLVPLQITWLSQRARVQVILAWLLLWPAVGLFLATFTDSDVPGFDGFTTAGSVIGQILLGRKFVETWAVWLLVNIASIFLLSYKQLYLSALLYCVFVVMAWLGWRRWRARLVP